MANSGPGLGAFRRVVFNSNNIAEIENDIKRLFDTTTFISGYKNLKRDIKKGAKENTLVVDLSGDGADSVAKKLKDVAIKFKADYKVKNEKPMNGLKENKNTINMNKELVRKIIKEEIEQVQAEQEGDVETASEVSKPRKLEKDELGKFYIVTQPAKAKDNIVHEMTMLEFANKVKSGEIDESKICGVYSSNGHAKSHAKDLLSEIDKELDELKDYMTEFRKNKTEADDKKKNALNIINKYKK